MQIIEKILSIPEFPDYLIYPNGEVYSKRRKIMLKPRYDKDGYKRISLKNVFTKKLETVKIHYLVSKCYLGYTKDCGLVVDHIDNDKNNNYLHNLQLITQEQNQRKEHFKKLQKKNGLPFYIHKSKNGYCVKFKQNFEKKNLGHFDSLEKALHERNEYFKDLFIGVKM